MLFIVDAFFFFTGIEKPGFRKEIRKQLDQIKEL